jgi:hypothetical protein
MTRWLLLAAVCLIIATSTCGAENVEKPSAQSPLAALPSPAGPHIEKIKALDDNEWLELGSPAADDKWGKARGRSWSSNMPAAANLRGAFVFAEGVHAYVKPDGHYMNDLWFYDIHAHRWICLYPGIEVKSIAEQIRTRALTVDDRGLLVDNTGEPLPPLLIHAYGYLGYDPDERKFITFGSQFGNYFTTGEGGVFAEAYKLYEKQRKGREFPQLSPFQYDVDSGRFECFPVKNAPGGQPYGANVLAWVGSKRQFFYGGTDGVWLLEKTKAAWQAVQTQGTPPAGIDHCAAYDPKRDRIYYHCREGKTASENFFIYDIQENSWTKPQPEGDGPLSATSYESIYSYDSVNDRLVILRLYDGEKDSAVKRGVYAYDPATNRWDDPLPLPSKVVEDIRNGNFGFYDAPLNAYFCHFASDSTDDGNMWVYRYKAPSD